MRTIWTLGLCLLLSREIFAAEPARAPVSSNTTTNSPESMAEADAEWASIVKAMRPPNPPAEWNGKQPTPEQVADFKKKTGDMAEAVAERAKDFSQKYPFHPKAAEARSKEKAFRAQAQQLRSVDLPPVAPGAIPEKQVAEKKDPAYEAKFAEAADRLRAARPKGQEAFLTELIKSGEALAREFPKETEGWRMLVSGIPYMEPTAALRLYRLMAESGPPEVRALAEPEIKRAEMIGKPLDLKFAAVDGRDISLAKLKGKVVLVDFWATWCGPCVASLPEVIDLYNRNHDQGFEIVGISFDEDCDEMKRFVKQRGMSWPQFCDGGGWQNAMNKEFQIRGIPTMFLIDKKGNLRDVNARVDLPQKIAELLKE